MTLSILSLSIAKQPLLALDKGRLKNGIHFHDVTILLLWIQIPLLRALLLVGLRPFSLRYFISPFT